MRQLHKIACVVIIALFFGCFDKSAHVEERRQYAIQRAKQVYVNSRSPMFQQWGNDILAALDSATQSSLQTAQVASATLRLASNGECVLNVFWLEDAPSIDRAELLIGKSNDPMIIDVSEQNQKQNIKDNKVTVVMVAFWIWKANDKISKNIGNILDVSELKVRLIRGDTAVTAWWPVSFYFLNRADGGTNAIRILNGKAPRN